jgi:MYXO-CTERM domain-containing protein
MRLGLLASAIATSLVVAASARADIGPPPSCPTGSHHEYLYGHRCVPDGSHLEPDPNGGVKTVSDGPAPTSAPPPSQVPPSPPAPTQAKAPDPAPTQTKAPDPAPTPAPPSQRGCTCDLGSAPSGHAGALAAVALGAALVARRRRSRSTISE